MTCLAKGSFILGGLAWGNMMFLGVSCSLPWHFQKASDPASSCYFLLLPLPLNLEFSSCFLSNSLHSSQIPKDPACLAKNMLLIWFISIWEVPHLNVGAPLKQSLKVYFLKDKIYGNRKISAYINLCWFSFFILFLFGLQY